jgi:hypothetical protein
MPQEPVPTLSTRTGVFPLAELRIWSKKKLSGESMPSRCALGARKRPDQ